jgi:hypothetical protein
MYGLLLNNMLTLILPILSAILSAFIEWLRIDSKKGLVANVSKFVSINIAIILFVICLALSVDYYDEISPIDVAVYLIYYASCRGVFYDVILNILRGLDIDYVSSTTNSIIDRLFVRKTTFWIIKFVYLTLAALSAIVWKTLTL